MKQSDVPQDDIPYYEGQTKVVYAKSKDGKYKAVGSTGWKAEEFVTKMAVNELHEQAKIALADAKSGVASPLAYHMYSTRHDLLSLSQTTGIWQWRIRRHFKPEVFSKLSEKVLTKYSEAIGKPINTIKNIPE